MYTSGMPSDPAATLNNLSARAVPSPRPLGPTSGFLCSSITGMSLTLTF